MNVMAAALFCICKATLIFEDFTSFIFVESKNVTEQEGNKIARVAMIVAILFNHVRTLKPMLLISFYKTLIFVFFDFRIDKLRILLRACFTQLSMVSLHVSQFCFDF